MLLILVSIDLVIAIDLILRCHARKSSGLHNHTKPLKTLFSTFLLTLILSQFFLFPLYIPRGHASAYWWNNDYQYRRQLTITTNEPDWLGGWDNRVKITIDSDDILSTLSDFPVLIYLSNSSGIFDEDVSFVFDKLQSDINRKKIAVTQSDGITQ